GLEEDGKRIEGNFQRIRAGIEAISQKAGGLTFSTEADKQQLLELDRQLRTLAQAKQEQKQQDRDRIATQKQLTDTTSLYVRELKAQQTALKQAFNVGDLDGLKRAALNIQALKQDSEQLSRAVRGTSSEFTNAKGSYNAAAAELAKLRAELRAIGGGLDDAGKGFSSANPRVQELQERIGKLDSQLKAADKSIGQSYRNVGNYADSIIEAVRALELEKTS
ncbi:hypothetical protein, partial [Hymenobacter crusticola]